MNAEGIARRMIARHAVARCVVAVSTIAWLPSHAIAQSSDRTEGTHQASPWYVRIGVLDAIYHSSATIATSGQAIPGWRPYVGAGAVYAIILADHDGAVSDLHWREVSIPLNLARAAVSVHAHDAADYLLRQVMGRVIPQSAQQGRISMDAEDEEIAVRAFDVVDKRLHLMAFNQLRQQCQALFASRLLRAGEQRLVEI